MFHDSPITCGARFSVLLSASDDSPDGELKFAAAR
jgi:hypothetical protein